MEAGLAEAETCCLYVKPQKGIIPFLFDCWADPVPHLLILKTLDVPYGGVAPAAQ